MNFSKAKSNPKVSIAKVSFRERLAKFQNKINKYYREKFVYRLFWGRNDLYKKFTHGFVIICTCLIIFTGFSFSVSNESTQTTTLSVSTDPVNGDVDLLEQGYSIQSILRAASTRSFELIEHKVKDGETFEDLSKKYNVSVKSIKMSNLNQIDYFSDSPEEGKQLLIPEINGLLLKVRDEDKDVEDIMGRITKGNRLDIIEINNLQGPEFEVIAGNFLLIPDGEVEEPEPPKPEPVFVPSPSFAAPPVTIGNGTIGSISFTNPLSNPGCAGYGFSRGYSSWHNGVDLPKAGGCPIRSVAAGTVEYAGYSSFGEGHMVRISHGNGLYSLYFHGDGTFYVTAGQQVAAGQDIMYMGCTGFCTGTHLHLSLRINGLFIDPSPYVPY